MEKSIGPNSLSRPGEKGIAAMLTRDFGAARGTSSHAFNSIGIGPLPGFARRNVDTLAAWPTVYPGASNSAAQLEPDGRPSSAPTNCPIALGCDPTTMIVARRCVAVSMTETVLPDPFAT